MIATATDYVKCFNTTYVQPSIEWAKNHKLLISGIGISILLGAACFQSPLALSIMNKNIKFLTIVVPIAYTIPAPFIGLGIAVTAAGSGGSISYEAGCLFDAYCKSIVKVWLAWFNFVGIAV